MCSCSRKSCGANRCIFKTCFFKHGSLGINEKHHVVPARKPFLQHDTSLGVTLNADPTYSGKFAICK